MERGAFEAMRRVEESHGAESFRGVDPGGRRFVRRGRVDSWREELSPGARLRIEELQGLFLCHIFPLSYWSGLRSLPLVDLLIR